MNKLQFLRKLRKIARLTIFRVTCDFSQFFVMLTIRSKASCEETAMFAKIAKNCKVDDFSRYLRFFAVLCHVND